MPLLDECMDGPVPAENGAGGCLPPEVPFTLVAGGHRGTVDGREDGLRGDAS